jgi:hypothetical protein
MFPKKYEREADFERDVIPRLRSMYGPNIWTFRTSYKRIQEMGGMPDWLFCFYGYFVAIEFKNGKTKKQSHEARQQYHLMKIREANGFSSVCRTPDEVFSAFASIKEIINIKS